MGGGVLHFSQATIFIFYSFKYFFISVTKLISGGWGGGHFPHPKHKYIRVFFLDFGNKTKTQKRNNKSFHEGDSRLMRHCVKNILKGQVKFRVEKIYFSSDR